MRITNSMIMNNAKVNINGNKVAVDAGDTQMTTQKKISRPSEDPVIAVRSLRLQTQLSKIEQYYKKNIPDAESWIKITDSALSNTISCLTRVKELTNQGANDINTETDRKTILQELKQLQQAVFSEGNADCAGRTVFTGFRTDKNLCFTSDDVNSNYNITQELSYDDLKTHRYYTNKVNVPAQNQIQNYGQTGLTSDDLMIQESDYKRLRLNYDDITDVDSVTFSYTDGSGNTVKNEVKFYDENDTNQYDNTKVPPLVKARNAETQGTRNVYDDDANPTPVQYQFAQATGSVSVTDTKGNAVTTNVPTAVPANVLVFANEDDWADWSKNHSNAAGDDKLKKYVPDDAMVLIKDTGDLIFGKDVVNDMTSKKTTVSVNYDKNGFSEGELKPEYYYDCVDNTDTTNRQVYRRSDIKYDIEYTVAMNQTLAVNLQANDCFDSSFQQDLTDLIAAISDTQNAADKVTKIKSMMGESDNQGADKQANLNKWLTAAQKEYDYYNDNLGKMLDEVHGNVDVYLEQANEAHTKLGCKGDELSITKSRMDEQDQTITDLQSENDNLDLSEILINYTQSYTAYQSSLIAAGKLGQQSLLNYI